LPKVTEDHKDSRRQQILQAAMACFVRKGIQQTTMADICREASLSRGAVYVYFKSKHEIIQGVYELSNETNRAAIAPTTPDRSPLDAILAMKQTARDFMSGPERELIARLDITMRAASLNDPAIMAQGRAVVDEVYAMLAQRLGRFPAGEGLPEGLDPEWLGRCLVAFVDGIKFQIVENPQLDVARLFDTLGLLFSRALQKRS